MMAVTFTACSSDDDNEKKKPTLGADITWDINADGDANVPAGEKWIITGTGKDTPHYITIGDGATVTLSGVNIDAYNTKDPEVGFVPAITCLGDATIILADGTTNILNGNPYPGIVVLTDKKVGTLTIKGTGSLEAKSSNGAGIGCPWNDENNMGVKMDCGNIVIESGNITATGFQEAPGIGGSGTNKCGDITIKGGNVTATGGFGPGIGCCGSESACGNILITGGKVTATGGDWGPAIGRDDMGMGTCGTITIGGTVYWDGWGYQNGGETYLTTKPFVYEQ
jgi:hypothetical protein